jgi:hypothetical protein
LRTTGGYGNVQGDNPGETRKGWAARIPGQAALIKTMGVDWFVALELHDNYAALLKALGSDWGIYEGRGGNQLLHRKAAGVKLRDHVNFDLGGGKQNRSATWWKITQHGQNFSVLGAHFISESIYLPVKILQARTLANFCLDHRIMRGICGVDLNSSTAVPGMPRSILRSVGWGGLRYKNDDVLNAHMASSVHGRDAKVGNFGPWIEDMLSAPYVTVVDAAGVPSLDVSDHRLWLRGTFDIKNA